MLRRCLLLLPLLLAAPAVAQDWPQRPVRMVLPFAPGGAVDSASRALAPKLSELLGQNVVMENRTGAGGSIAAAAVAQAAPDGYTLLMDASNHMVNPSLLRGLPFDYATAFIPVGQFVIYPQVLTVKDSLPVRTVEEFIALAKREPGRISFGSPGNATAGHLAGEFLLRCQGLQMQHIPYRGGADAVRDLAAGNIDAVTATMVSARAMVEAGRIRPLASLSRERIALLPNVPALSEGLCPGFDVSDWAGLFAPAGTPDAVVARLSAALRTALADATLRERLAGLGAVPVGSTPAEFTAMLKTGTESWGRLVREAGIRVD